ncbi:hypothetical protein HNQ56_001213 [Anaerotaenia torta]|uniref:sensor histidine kinase n=1 Tax=Anaerotaenia torta TaxID=433293 RepID=UPI003D1D592B
MIRTLQRRFVLTAMLSLFVLLIIVIGGIIGASYFIMERNTDQALEMLSVDRPRTPPTGDERRPIFGYQLRPNLSSFMNHCVVLVDTKGEVAFINSGFYSNYDESEIYEYALRILDGSKMDGKIGSFKYKAVALDSSRYRIIFLDMSAQAQMLADTVIMACLIGLACLFLMFIILIIVSRRTVLPISESIEKQRRFVTDAGHEIKTPLAIIQANVDAMELHNGKNKWSKHIQEQAVRLDGLMKQLLSLAKMDEGEAAIPFENVAFSKLVENCVSAFSEMGCDKKIISDIPPSISLRGNRESLEQLVSILMDNAIKYSEVDGTITVKLTTIGKKAILEVINTCIALPDAPPNTLFDRFYRADTARTQKSGGYGVGLSIARAITEIHRGKISAFYDNENTIRFRVEI